MQQQQQQHLHYNNEERPYFVLFLLHFIMVNHLSGCQHWQNLTDVQEPKKWSTGLSRKDEWNNIVLPTCNCRIISYLFKWFYPNCLISCSLYDTNWMQPMNFKVEYAIWMLSRPLFVDGCESDCDRLFFPLIFDAKEQDRVIQGGKLLQYIISNT